ncbi:MAG: alpha/beta fold hydrolase [Gammaproteobacteria bacterium]|nr:alpha/beta fold hydrolase [Pseudomonadales bacterium]
MTDSSGLEVNEVDRDDGFVPRFWLRNGHAQTLWRKFVSAPQIDQRRQRLELSDGDFIDIDWHDPVLPESARTGTIVLLLHGLCGCSRSGYILSLQDRLGKAGYLSVAMNFRGCSGEANRLAKAYHSGVTGDLAEVFAALQKQFPDHRFAVAGFSLGANVLLKWLGETGIEMPVSRAVAVSTPFNLTLCSRAMLTGLSQFYGRYFLRRLVAEVESKKEHFQRTDNDAQLARLRALGDLSELNSLWDFDDRVTAPLHGFQNASDYYAQCSSMQFLHGIRVPTLLLQSRDDPIIPPAALPGDRHLSDNLMTEFSDYGGHVGFAAATDRLWMENRIAGFIAGDCEPAP